MKEVGRELTIDPEVEAKLLAVARQPPKDVLVVIQDTGMRPEESFGFGLRTSTGVSV
jgi:hypothetical protein